MASESFYESAYDDLADKTAAWMSLINVHDIQRKSGLIAAHDNAFGGDFFPDVAPKIAALIIELGINQKMCEHPAELQEVIGHVPMGSFTANRELCRKCGRISLDD